MYMYIYVYIFVCVYIYVFVYHVRRRSCGKLKKSWSAPSVQTETSCHLLIYLIYKTKDVD